MFGRHVYHAEKRGFQQGPEKTGKNKAGKRLQAMELPALRFALRRFGEPAEQQLGGSQELLLLIAAAAADDEVPLRAPAAARNRNDVIERKLFRRKLLPAVMADSLPEQIPVIRRFAQFARFRALTPDMPFVAADFHPVIHADLFSEPSRNASAGKAAGVEDLAEIGRAHV